MLWHDRINQISDNEPNPIVKDVVHTNPLYPAKRTTLRGSTRQNYA